jgi:glutaredoxin-like protein
MAEALLGPREADKVREYFGQLPRGVRLITFRRNECESCDALEQLARELADLSPNLAADVVTEGEDTAETFAAFGIEQVPALAVSAGDGAAPDNGIRFYGFPGGYEFESLLDAITRVAANDAGLSPELAEEVQDADAAPRHVRVFVTPTCPYCPRMVKLAHRMALLNPSVRADMVDALEFPELAQRYGVRGVPLTVVDDEIMIEGAVPEQHLLQQLRDHRPVPPGIS